MSFTSQMPNDIIFPTETNFPIKSRSIFYFVFPHIWSFSDVHDIFTISSNQYIENHVERDLFRTKNPEQNLPRLPKPPHSFSLTDFPKCLKNFIFPKFQVNTLIVHVNCCTCSYFFLKQNDVCVISFFPNTAWLWNSLPIKLFPLIYDLNGFKSRINTF